MQRRTADALRAAAANGLRGTLQDGTSRLRLPDGTELQHELQTACFAERAVVAAASAVPLPDGLPLWQAALLGCAVVTGFGAVRNVAGVRAGESVVVIGAGGVGLQVLAAAKLAGAAPIVVVDRDASRLARATERGADHVVDTSTDERIVRTLRTLTGGGADHAFEVVGLPETMLLAWKAIRPGATAVVVGLAEKGVDVCCRRSTSCPTRAFAGATTARATRRRTFPHSRARASTVSSISRASCRT